MTSGVRFHCVNEDFFNEWTSEMAYILGFTITDGCVYERTLSWEISNKHLSDRKLLESFNKIMNSNYPIEIKEKSFRLRINSLKIVESLKDLGIIQNKSKIVKFPNVSKEFLRHFIRGILDGDGWISIRNRKFGSEVTVGFCSGSLSFMKGLVSNLKSCVNLSVYNLRKREKITKNGVQSFVYQLDFYSKNAQEILKFIYKDLKDEDIFLDRKYNSYLKAKNIYNEISKYKRYGRNWIDLENRYGLTMQIILSNMLNEDNLIPREMALKLNISLATLYRWLEKSRVRIPEKQYTQEWSNRIVASRRIVNGR
jgi:intein/homing endonuclease